MPKPFEDFKRTKERTISWVDSHPRTGWYLMVLMTLNLLLSVVDLFK